MKVLLILVLSLFLVSGNKSDENLELRIFNNSRFKIEKLKITYKNQETEFLNIAPKSYSEIRLVKGLWKDNCYDLTVYKKKFLVKNFWSHQICFPIDHIGDNKIESGKCTLSLKIKQIDRAKVAVESEYIVEKKTSDNSGFAQ